MFQSSPTDKASSARSLDAAQDLSVLAEAASRELAADFPRWLEAELRSDHAGETGAVFIYRGILTFARNPEIRRFARTHQATEEAHLAALSHLLEPKKRSRLLPLWKIAGWVTGALPALVGDRAVYITIDAVETFVDRHYQEQIDALRGDPSFAHTHALLVVAQSEEIHHRDEAREAHSGPLREVNMLAQEDPARAGDPKSGLGLWAKAWSGIVAGGSKAAVWAARKV